MCHMCETGPKCHQRKSCLVNQSGYMIKLHLEIRIPVYYFYLDIVVIFLIFLFLFLILTPEGSVGIPFTTTDCDLPVRKLYSHWPSFPVIPWSTLSKAEAKSKHITSTFLPSSICLSTLSYCACNWLKHERPFQKPCWFWFMILLDSR